MLPRRCAQTFAITGGTVALGDGSEPIHDGTVVIRDGRVVAAGNVRMSLPAGAQVIDATGKWVTPGIVAGFSRLGLAEVDLSADGSRRHQPPTAPFSAAIDVAPAINPLNTTVAVNRADGVTRAFVAPGAGKSIFAGPGRGDRPRRRHGPDHRARARFQFVELGETGNAKAGGSRSSAHVLFRNALARGGGAAALRARRSRRRRARPTSASARSIRNPNESRIYGPTRAAARTCC